MNSAEGFCYKQVLLYLTNANSSVGKVCKLPHEEPHIELESDELALYATMDNTCFQILFKYSVSKILHLQ